MKIRKVFVSLLLVSAVCFPLRSQTVVDDSLHKSLVFAVDTVFFADSLETSVPGDCPLFSFIQNKETVLFDRNVRRKDRGEYYCKVGNVKVTYTSLTADSVCSTGRIVMENIGNGTVIIEKLIPFDTLHAEISILGNNSELMRKGYQPVEVILPENVADMGYSSLRINDSVSLCGMVRKENGRGDTCTVLKAGDKAVFDLYLSRFSGIWQQGINLMFRDNLLYDVADFNKSLYKRDDLSWVRRSYLMVFENVWDVNFYNRSKGRYTYTELLKTGIDNFGSLDAIGLCAVSPMSGFDKRNQIDNYILLPGSTKQMKSYAQLSRRYGTHFLISFDPYEIKSNGDSSYLDLSLLLDKVEADGIFMQKKYSKWENLQPLTDKVRKGVVTFPPITPAIRDMQNVIAGTVDESRSSYKLNINKYIMPELALFKQYSIGSGSLNRDVSVAFFNGYGMIVNLMGISKSDEDNLADGFSLLAGTTFTLRQNNDVFLDSLWIPLIDTNVDSIFVNKWTNRGKTLYTVLNMRNEGFSGNLFGVSPDADKHYVSLCNHRDVETDTVGGERFLKVDIPGLAEKGDVSIDCFAGFDNILHPQWLHDTVQLFLPARGKLVVWKGNPGYGVEHVGYESAVDTLVKIPFIDFVVQDRDKFVCQLLSDSVLVDEYIVNTVHNIPLKINTVKRTERSRKIPAAMMLIPGAHFSFRVVNDCSPEIYAGSDTMVAVDSFLIDKYPVTNAQYYDFVISTGYIPADTTGYLIDWVSGMYRQGQDNYPVVNISIDDARAYAEWAGKRLPTEAEWQLAAQGTDGRKWPWGNTFYGTHCNNSFNRSTPVDAFAKGQSPYGVMDLVGNVWQMTDDVYFNGKYYFNVIRGGSYYVDRYHDNVRGGPQQLDKTQIMMLLYPGYERSRTVGFRCVMDVDRDNFKSEK